MKSPKSTKKAETQKAASLTKMRSVKPKKFKLVTVPWAGGSMSPARLVRQDCKATLAEVARLISLGE